MKTLYRNATIITMDQELGILQGGDLLVDGTRIAEVGHKLSAADAQVIDCEGNILMPGLVNAHMHTWQTALRGFAANWTLLEYFKNVHRGLATLFSPEDIYISNYMGALNQINAGTTTLGDWCHNNPTPDHTDAAIKGLQDARIRGVFMHGSPKPDPKPGQPHFSEVPHPRGEIERLTAGPLGEPDSRVTLAMAILGPHYSTLDVTLSDFELAREHDLVVSMHQGGGQAVTPGGWDELERRDWLNERVNIVHGHGLSDAQIKRFCARGVTFSVAPENEMTQGHGFPIVGKLRPHNGVISLGVDLESVLSGDMFTVARMALGMQRSMDNAESREVEGTIPETSTISTEEALRWITIDGAKALGLEHKIGSLTPGKQADVLLLESNLINMAPVHDPVATVVMQASLANVDSVMVAGEFLKQFGKLRADAVPHSQQALAKSGRRIVEALRHKQVEESAS